MGEAISDTSVYLLTWKPPLKFSNLLHLGTLFTVRMAFLTKTFPLSCLNPREGSSVRCRMCCGNGDHWSEVSFPLREHWPQQPLLPDKPNWTPSQSIFPVRLQLPKIYKSCSEQCILPPPKAFWSKYQSPGGGDKRFIFQLKCINSNSSSSFCPAGSRLQFGLNKEAILG